MNQPAPHSQPTLDHKAARSGRFALVFAGACIALLVLVFIGVAAGLVPRMQHEETLRIQTRQLAKQTVNVVSPGKSNATAEQVLPGEIKPWMETSIYSRANGFLRKRHVDIGSHVSAGQLLAEIDTPELDQEIERARSLLTQAQASLELAQVTAGRWNQLVASGSISEQEANEKQSDLKLKLANAEYAKAEVRRLEELKSFAKIVAPFAGVITVRNTDEGELIVAGSNKELFHLVQPDKLRVSVRVPESMARAVSPGQQASLTLTGMSSSTLAAQVVRIAGAMEENTRTLLVELEADNTNKVLLAGGSAQVKFTPSTSNTVLTVPANTVLFRADGPQLCVVLADGTVEVRSVTLGRDFGKTIEIVAGIAKEDRIIVNPADTLVAGANVLVAASK